MGGNVSSRELKKAVTTKDTGEGEGSTGSTTFKYGWSSCQGWRKQMEDAHLARTEIAEVSNGSLFGVFDGHGGPGAAHFAATHLPAYLKETWDSFVTADKLNETSETANLPEEAKAHAIAERIGDALQHALIRLDRYMSSHVDLYRTAMCMEDPGSTVATALLLENHIVLAHLGDARVVISRDGSPFFATKDHKPDDPTEEMRIVEAGGFVVGGRVCRCLAVSRAVGDHFFKNHESSPEKHMVTAMADVAVITRDHEHDEFMLIACDGVWDVMTNRSACEFVRNKLLEESSVANICSELLDHCLSAGSTDNMTCLLVVFPAATLKDNVGDIIDDLFTGLSGDEDEEGGDDGEGMAAGNSKSSDATENEDENENENNKEDADDSTADKEKEKEEKEKDKDKPVAPPAASSPPQIRTIPGNSHSIPPTCIEGDLDMETEA